MEVIKTERLRLRPLFPAIEQFDEVEAAWTLRPESWGKGYAAEAARAFVDWGWERLDVPYIIAMIHPGNDSSVRVAKRLGFTVRRQDVLTGKQVTVYSLDRSERLERPE